jgi:hypothetical protein
MALEESYGLTNLILKLGIENNISLDIRNGEIDEHTSDLWCKFFPSQILYMLVDEISNLCLVVGIRVSDQR